MNQQQLQDLIDAMGNAMAANRGVKRPPPFKDPDALSWATWRSQFEAMVGLNHWLDPRARQELKVAMEGTAARIVQDIPHDAGVIPPPPVPGQPPVPAHPEYTHLLDLFEARFVTVADTDASKAEFKQATQKRGETVLAWHSRIRELFGRAYPAVAPAAVETNEPLIDRFILGLTSPAVKEYVLDHRPNTFAAALTHANTKIATQKTMQGDQPSKGRGEPGPQVSAVGADGGTTGPPRKGGKIKCFHCNQQGHIRPECPLWKKSLKEVPEFLKAQEEAKKKRARKNPQPKRIPRPSVNLLQEEEKPTEEQPAENEEGRQ